MNKENRKQKELEKRMARVWQSYASFPKEKQTELTDHTFSFHLDDTGAGWEYVHFVLDGESFGFRISYIGPDVSSFVSSAASLGKKRIHWFLPGTMNRVNIPGPFPAGMMWSMLKPLSVSRGSS